ncbi:UNVERIFIED_CONTAM: hypothetical protein FKN15_043404 [Acipenser sinensis]
MTVCGGSMHPGGENGCFLYGVFNGYDGSHVVNFMSQRLSAELLLGQLNASHSDADVRRVLLQVREQPHHRIALPAAVSVSFNPSRPISSERRVQFIFTLTV